MRRCELNVPFPAINPTVIPQTNQNITDPSHQPFCRRSTLLLTLLGIIVKGLRWIPASHVGSRPLRRTFRGGQRPGIDPRPRDAARDAVQRPGDDGARRAAAVCAGPRPWVALRRTGSVLPQRFAWRSGSTGQAIKPSVARGWGRTCSMRPRKTGLRVPEYQLQHAVA